VPGRSISRVTAVTRMRLFRPDPVTAT